MRTRAVLLLDLGTVLVHLDYARVMPRLAVHCGLAGTAEASRLVDHFNGLPHLADYESGRIGGADFFALFIRETGFSGSLEEFNALWRGIFSENEPMIAFARGQANERDLYCLTNAGSMHVPYLFDRYPSLGFFKGVAASWEVGALKPASLYYERALKRFGLRPEDGLFIDDRSENVEGARACGIEALLYTSPGETIAAAGTKLAEMDRRISIRDNRASGSYAPGKTDV